MDSLCQRLEILTGQLSQSIRTLDRRPPGDPQEKHTEELHRAAEFLRSLPNSSNSFAHTRRFATAVGRDVNSQSPINARKTFPLEAPLETDDTLESSSSESEDFDIEPNNGSHLQAENENEGVGRAGALVLDSYKRLRFVGGATNNMLIEAAKSLLSTVPIQTPPPTTGASHSTPSLESLEVPLFTSGKIWPELPYLPKPESLPRPPQYVSDLLVSLYFEKLHYTFPVLFKPYFMRRYQKMLRTTSDCSTSKHGRFLMTFFAVCACSSGLLPSNSAAGLPGIEYYQKALLMCYAAAGEASLERVQCLSLLAMCSAGWNTLSQSWNLAGQAVRAALDLGLHLSSHSITTFMPKTPKENTAEFSKLQISRRVWWCVYTLDRITSICLGRPMAVQDEDCDCELPLDMRDDDVGSYHNNQEKIHVGGRGPSSPMSGFLAFARLCRLSGKIQQFSSPLKLRNLASADADRTQKFLARVDAYDQVLRKWLESLPGDIQFSANRMDKGYGNISMVNCVTIFFLHAGSLINLYRFFLSYPKEAALRHEIDTSGAISQCINAAKGCIYAADLVRDLVPSSHHLAMCVHYLTISGILLLRIPLDRTNNEIFDDVERCAASLKDLEPRWSGASRSRAIIEQLLLHRRTEFFGVPDKSNGNTDCTPTTPGISRAHKRKAADFDNALSPSTGNSHDLLGSGSIPESHEFNHLDTVLFPSWAG
ncbi:zn 2cys6 transcription factor [Colletotrichum incanum]|uniref:Zn 2cys6 transcription factor n=1 Tax=Colletotrichum incanum TaxID=1573173 RepID=A0A162PG39_COLIC|nr:zn 2cys6 transcription factor [Colletotrichum incanum]